jgi:hypothetical protein
MKTEIWVTKWLPPEEKGWLKIEAARLERDGIKTRVEKNKKGFLALVREGQR